jgi:transposase
MIAAMSCNGFDHRDDHKVDPRAREVRRIEVINGVGGRRRWPAELKARIVMESLEEGVAVAEVARRHGLRPQQLFDWRRKYRESLHAPEPMPFAPVVLDKPGQSSVAQPRMPAAVSAGPVPEFEIVSGSFAVRLRGAVDGKALAIVLRAVKAAS